ncbi:dihydrodipicolinate synthase family protein [Sporomusa sp.]|uniref:dihydrodipicolinate synthase family protein n=1 Tax=Sporomusa sp. TaxID=2078658 RepID=UPI002C15ED26|nr:dihydrodipicolinate synthase family protein [Sporomusa sp.]HWR45692.1 dihydrodipicolinate synthase family protein [Sporomusa sp.]
MFKPAGVYSAMLTPFKADGNINEDVLRRMVDFMIAKGLHGLFPVSSVGEFAHISLEQCFQCMEIVVDQAKGRVAITPGVSSTCAENSIKLAQKAEKLGCQGVVICPPYYYPISQENMERHFELVADSINIPVILYNIPLFATPISNDVVKRLSRRDNIVGMKDSSGSMVELMHYMDKVRLTGSDMNFLVGREEILAPALTVGASGCMTASSGIIPEIMVGIWDAYHAGDYAKANRIQIAMLPFIRAMFAAPFPIGFKAALEMRGFDMGPHKQPLSAAEEFNLSGVKARIKNILQGLLEFIQKEGLDKEK